MTSANLIFISVALAFLFGALALFLRGKLQVASRRKIFLISGLITASAGLWLVTYSAADLTLSINKLSWPSVSGIVVSSTVINDQKIYPQIIYRYEIDSQKFIDTSDFGAPGFGGKGTRRQTARKLSALFPAGERVNVFYDPSQPSYSFLRRGLGWGGVFRFGFGAMLLCAGGFLLGLSVPRSGETKRNSST